MRPGGSTPDRALRTPTDARRITKTGQRSRNLERRFAPAGAAFVSEQETVNGNNVSCVNNANTPLTIDGTFGPDSLIDFSTPAAPVWIKAGTVIVTAQMQVDPGTPLAAGAFFGGVLGLGAFVSATVDTPPSDGAGFTTPGLSLCVAAVVSAGDLIFLTAGLRASGVNRNIALVGLTVVQIT